MKRDLFNLCDPHTTVYSYKHVGTYIGITKNK